MKRLVAVLAMVAFLAAVSGPALADNAKPMKTPTTKTLKHKKSRHKGVNKGKKTMKPSSTPTAKK